MPKLPGINHLRAIKALEKAGFRVAAETQMLIEEVKRVANAPVSLLSVGFSHRAVLDRRSW
jgi:hypothetical protein